MEDSRQVVVNNPSSVGHTLNKLLPLSWVIIHMMLMCEFVFQTSFLQVGFATLTPFVMIMHLSIVCPASPLPGNGGDSGDLTPL